jgi:hypothetical protein
LELELLITVFGVPAATPSPGKLEHLMENPSFFPAKNLPFPDEEQNLPEETLSGNPQPLRPLTPLFLCGSPTHGAPKP